MTEVAQRVNELDNQKEGAITLSQYQVDLIWGRLNASKYKLVRVAPQFLEFVANFQVVIGKHFPEDEPVEG